MCVEEDMWSIHSVVVEAEHPLHVFAVVRADVSTCVTCVTCVRESVEIGPVFCCVSRLKSVLLCFPVFLCVNYSNILLIICFEENPNTYSYGSGEHLWFEANGCCQRELRAASIRRRAKIIKPITRLLIRDHVILACNAP